MTPCPSHSEPLQAADLSDTSNNALGETASDVGQGTTTVPNKRFSSNRVTNSPPLSCARRAPTLQTFHGLVLAEWTTCTVQEASWQTDVSTSNERPPSGCPPGYVSSQYRPCTTGSLKRCSSLPRWDVWPHATKQGTEQLHRTWH